MPLKFKVIQKSQPGVSGGGAKKYYASPVYSGELTLEDMTSRIEKISTVSGADIRAVLYAFSDILPDALSNGFIVRLGEVGSFRQSISSEGKEEESAVTASAIRDSRILFTPGKRLKDALKTAKYEKAP